MLGDGEERRVVEELVGTEEELVEVKEVEGKRTWRG